ncbi:biotin carboxylase N-terminal domain-containing protein [Candidatus Poriferisocius sp.]|uniref:acetyl/propionyl/methylcrotonyl-CoA carboxylase subunit alpha n=1 Tax=Candidatus Poriferisocius sp. TaxID=3101276 RepID=UPI003B5C961D
MKILIANRAEIARRVIRTARRLGHATVAVYAEPDAGAPFVADADEAVPIGPADLAASYLSVERLLDAAAISGADAVHPGYGFLSENAAFATAVIDAGLVWIGPNPSVIEAMGSKIEARRIAAAAGVPVIPGYDESQQPADLVAAAERIGYPILVKAAAGGGGKGIRIAQAPEEFERALDEAVTEAERSFGDGRVIVERFITRPRHVEVQVVGDRHGGVIELGTRECSVQRRYQKVLEEAPAPNLAEPTRQGLRAAAAELARFIGYDSTGTVEFVVDDETGDFFFLEMNTRLQVEHPVTEFITGLDLVELQIAVATGEPLPVTQYEIAPAGHAFEARINAEDATRGFAPRIGTVSHLSVPPDVRWESAVEAGTTITPHYDPMIAKLIVGGPDREAARRRLGRALEELLIGGVVTNTGFHRWLIDQPPVVAGRVTTRFLDEAELPGAHDRATAADRAAAAWMAARRDAAGAGPWTAPGDRRFTPHRPTRRIVLEDQAGEVHEIVPETIPEASAPTPPSGVSHVDLPGRQVAVNVDGQSHTFSVRSRSEHWAPAGGAAHGHAGSVVAPFPALVTEVPVKPGDAVAGGDTVVVIEAMKMLHTLTAGGPGVVAEVRVAPGQQVATNQVLVTFEEDE